MGGVKDKILFLTNNKNTLELYHWISERSTAFIFSDRLSVEALKGIDPKIVISYNYDYIVSKECIDAIDGSIINMHISLLPWNRGFSPNIWSFIDDTPKGVTIHMMSEGLDTGDILYQQELNFDVTKETFETSYTKLNNEIVALFKEHWEEIYSGTYRWRAFAQNGMGSYHDMNDLCELQNKISFEWNENIEKFLIRYHKYVVAMGEDQF